MSVAKTISDVDCDRDNLEIHKPELLQRVNAQIRSRRLHDVDELLDRALDALDERSPVSTSQTGAAVLAALEAGLTRISI
jgi:hypothetical protein